MQMLLIGWAIGFVAIALGGALLVLARRHKNQDSTAGACIAGWTVGMLIFWLFVSGDVLNLIQAAAKTAN